MSHVTLAGQVLYQARYRKWILISKMGEMHFAAFCLLCLFLLKRNKDACMYGLCGDYNYYGLLRLVSRFIIVGV